MATVVNLGTWQNTSGATAVSAAFTVPAGSLIVVFTMEDDATATSSSITTGVGSGNPVWNGPFGAGTDLGAMFYAFNASISSQTLIFTKGTGSGNAACSACYATGMLLTDPLAGVVSSGFTANNVSLGPATPSGPTVFFGMAGTTDGSAGVQSAGFANPPNAITTNAAVQIVMAGSQASQSPVTYAPTYTSGGGADCVGILVAMQAVADAPFVPNDWPIYRHWWDRG